MTELLTSHAAISLENARLLEETHHAYKRLQENQEHMLQMEKLSALGTLVGGVAHEINNPLMGVMNFVEFAADKAVDAKSREVLEQALHEIHRIKTIVRNMLIFVRTRADQTDACDIRTVVNQTLLLLAGELKKSGIKVNTNLQDNLPEVVCGANSLQQVLVNLLLNARDALSGCADPRIDISARLDGPQVMLVVCDNGPGIPDKLLSKVFDPFFTTKPPGKGTGLGLSVSARLIKEAGGSITAHQEDGNGCCMRIQFNTKQSTIG